MEKFICSVCGPDECVLSVGEAKVIPENCPFTSIDRFAFWLEEKSNIIKMTEKERLKKAAIMLDSSIDKYIQSVEEGKWLQAGLHLATIKATAENYGVKNVA